MENLIRVGDALKQLGVHRNTIVRWEQQGRVTPLRGPGGVRYYRKRDIERLARERQPKLDGPARPGSQAR